MLDGSPVLDLKPDVPAFDVRETNGWRLVHRRPRKLDSDARRCSHEQAFSQVLS